MQSVIRVVFHERRLQYMEREQLAIWRQTRPGERIVDIGLLSVIFSVFFSLLYSRFIALSLQCSDPAGWAGIRPVKHWVLACCR